MTDLKDSFADRGHSARRNSYPSMAWSLIRFELRWLVGTFLLVFWLPGFIQAQRHESAFGPVL